MHRIGIPDCVCLVTTVVWGRLLSGKPCLHGFVHCVFPDTGTAAVAIRLSGTGSPGTLREPPGFGIRMYFVMNCSDEI